MGYKEMLNDERIPNMVSKYESKNIWHPFGQKTVGHWQNTLFRPYLEFPHHLASLTPSFVIFSTFWTFGLPCYYLTKIAGGSYGNSYIPKHVVIWRQGIHFGGKAVVIRYRARFSLQSRPYGTFITKPLKTFITKPFRTETTVSGQNRRLSCGPHPM